MQNPLKLEKRLENRKQDNAFRNLNSSNGLIDFSSNDYLGFASSPQIFQSTTDILKETTGLKNGSTGSRLLTGNHELYRETEDFLSHFHHSDAAVVFNSGYDANLGFFASVPQREDIVFYDELIHASIRDAMSLGKAKSIKFKHNDLQDLLKRIKRISENREINGGDIYIVTESVFSMDGDIPDLLMLAEIAEDKGYFLVVDEAHSTGVFGEKGEGLVQEIGITNKIFARIITFGKAMGGHGAAILGSKELREYLINFARSFIFTTALPPHSVAGILAAYHYLQSPAGQAERKKLLENILFFKKQIQQKNIHSSFVPGISPIQSFLIQGNEEVKTLSGQLREGIYDVKPILSPTVPKGAERLRICLHSFNTREEIEGLLKLIAIFIK